MDRRNFFRTMIGGVAAAAAVRTWPFRVYSFPKEIITSRLDLGYSCLDYSGLPIISSPFVPAGKIFMVRLVEGKNGRKEFHVGEGVEVENRPYSRSIGAPSWIRDSLASAYEKNHLSVIEGKVQGVDVIMPGFVANGRRIIGPLDEK